MELAPDPQRVRSLVDLISALRLLKLQYGSPSISSLTDRCGGRGGSGR